MKNLEKIISSKSLPYFFYSIWFLIALWQANYTDLLNDEAYYWKYSQFLDWGYFDHPPMVALLIKLGTSMFGGEIGVRLLFTLLGTTTIFITQLIINPENKQLYYIIISSIGILYFTSFLALPDTSLLFFTAVFFLLLKRYDLKRSVSTAILLGIVSACLLLSKYHGFIILAVALFSNLHYLKSKTFYLIIIIAFLGVLPHYFWQVNHDFPSIQYHFHDRNLNAYSINNTLSYLVSQLFLFGPFISIILWFAFLKTTPNSAFEKTLKRLIFITFIFFLLLTFKGKVQGHWTTILFIPLVYFGYNTIVDRPNYLKWTYYQWPVSLVIIFTVKLGLVLSLPQNIDTLFKDFKGKATWAKAIEQSVKNKPVVFMNSYQNASIYEFYTGHLAISITNVMSRRNQYDLWQYEDSLRGKEIAIIPNYPVNGFDTLTGVVPISQYAMINNFQHYGQVTVTPQNWIGSSRTKDSLAVNLKIENTDSFSFNENTDFPSVISYTFFEYNRFVSQHRTNIRISEMGNDQIDLKIKVPEKRSVYQVYFSIQTGWLPPSLNSKVYQLKLD